MNSHNHPMFAVPQPRFLNDLQWQHLLIQILYNQAIIDGIIRSAELGREIEIEIPEI